MDAATPGVFNTLAVNWMEPNQEDGIPGRDGMIYGQMVRMILAEAALMGLWGGYWG